MPTSETTEPIVLFGITILVWFSDMIIVTESLIGNAESIR